MTISVNSHEQQSPRHIFQVRQNDFFSSSTNVLNTQITFMTTPLICVDVKLCNYKSGRGRDEVLRLFLSLLIELQCGDIPTGTSADMFFYKFE